MIALNFIENGMMYSILPFASLNYVKGEEVLKWSILLAMIIDPFACLFTNFFKTFKYIYLVPVWLSISLFILIIAILSPTPPFASHLSFSIFLIICNVVNRAFIAYTKTIIYLDFKRILDDEFLINNNPNLGEKLFRWAGFSIQLGSGMGSILFFLLINVFKVFKQK